MKILHLLILTSLLAWIRVDGLFCWTCINAPTNEACKKHGEYKECQANENTCHNSVRRGDDGVKITKRCKQDLACANNNVQNQRAAWRPRQCNRGTPSSVCRCCCAFDGCNGPAFICHTRPNCDLLPTPTFATQKCDKEYIGIGTTCSFECDEDYVLIGDASSRCVKDTKFKGIFNNPSPKCIRRTCPAQLKRKPQHGSMNCTDGNYVRSVCTFACNGRHSLRGSEKVICEKGGLWSSPSPSCVLARCPIRPRPKNGRVTCTTGNMEDSTCRYQCFRDYTLMGSSISTCMDVDSVGVWSHDMPLCKLKTCPSIESFTNAAVTCSDANNIHSKCNFSCDGKRSMVGGTEITCIDLRGETKWDHKAPICELILCADEGPFKDGSVNCTNKNMLGSVCTYSCQKAQNDSFNPDEVTKSECLIDTTWSSPRPCCSGSASCPKQTNVEAEIESVVLSTPLPETYSEKMDKFIKSLLEYLKLTVAHGISRGTNENE